MNFHDKGDFWSQDCPYNKTCIFACSQKYLWSVCENTYWLDQSDPTQSAYAATDRPRIMIAFSTISDHSLHVLIFYEVGQNIYMISFAQWCQWGKPYADVIGRRFLLYQVWNSRMQEAHDAFAFWKALLPSKKFIFLSQGDRYCNCALSI